MKQQRRAGTARRKKLWSVVPAWLGSESRQRSWFICVHAKQPALDWRSPGSVLPASWWVPRATALLGAETSGGSSRSLQAGAVWGPFLSSSLWQDLYGLTPDVHAPTQAPCGCEATSVTWEKRPETGVEGDGAPQLLHAVRCHRSHWDI